MTATLACGSGVGVTVEVTVVVAVGVGVAVAAAVGVGVIVKVAVNVAVRVAVGVGVLVKVAVDVAVLVAVAVGVLVNVGVDVAVLVAVAVGEFVTVGTGVAVLVAVAVGATNVTDPSVLVAGIGELEVSLSDALSASGELPSATVAKRTVARMPVPLAPPKPPVEEQPKVKLAVVVVGGRQVTVRPVDPRNGPFVTLVNDSTLGSHVSATG